MNLEAGYTEAALAELEGFAHILDLAVSSPSPSFRIAVDSRAGELTCGMISVLAPLQGAPGAAEDARERLMGLCRDLVKRGANGKARRDVEELKEKCGVLHPIVDSIIG